jgi:glutamyl/glutaminyl-tRNA synthetase
VTRPTLRIAPTPSGYLHVGNAVNFLVNQWWARANDARLLLRIDDFDGGRVRSEYLADIFDTVRWLGIRIDAGPRDPQHFADEWSMAGRLDSFRQACDRLLATHPDVAFACRCSRTQLDAQRRCTADCRQVRPGDLGRACVRLSVRPGAEVHIDGVRTPVPPGDHVVWRRDDLPAYLLGSVVADEALGITTIIRGRDLWQSSALQVHLASLLSASGFLAAQLVHHELVLAKDGRKLSKSAGAQAHPLDRTPEQLRDVRTLAQRIGAPLGVGPT